jgi:hypothetical protein
LAEIRREIDSVDVAMYHAIATTPTPTVNNNLRRLSRSADRSMLWLSIASALALVPGRPRRAALLGAASIGVASLSVNAILKMLLRRSRPAATEVPMARQCGCLSPRRSRQGTLRRRSRSPPPSAPSYPGSRCRDSCSRPLSDVLYVKARGAERVLVCAGGVSGLITLPVSWTDRGEPPQSQRLSAEALAELAAATRAIVGR